MNEVDFRNWLVKNDVNRKVQSDIVSRIKKIEKEIENCDIDEQYRSDKCESIMALFLNMGINDEMKKYPIKNPKEKKHFNISNYFKPEYREDGYFCSKDFEEKCEIFDKFVEENDMDIPKELRGEALKIFLKENFNIDWEWDENKRLLDEYKDEIKIVY